MSSRIPPPEFKCAKCGSFFEELHVQKYQEYAGASFQENYVSPCCFEYYEEVEGVLS